jgi:hypothetical protein
MVKPASVNNNRVFASNPSLDAPLPKDISIMSFVIVGQRFSIACVDAPESAGLRAFAIS